MSRVGVVVVCLLWSTCVCAVNVTVTNSTAQSIQQHKARVLSESSDSSLLSTLSSYNHLSLADVLRKVRSSQPAPKPVYDVPPAPDGFSSSYKFEAHGFGAIVGRNVCIKRGRVEIYLPKTAQGDTQMASFKRKYFSFKYGLFGDKSAYRTPIPKSYKRVPGSFWVITPPWLKHIGHGWDGLAFVWYAYVHPGVAPMMDGPVEGALFFTLSGADYQYLKDLRPLVMKPFKTSSGGAVPIHDAAAIAGMNHGDGVCFEQMVFPGLPAGGFPYPQSRFFNSLEDAAAFREFVFKELSIPPLSLPANPADDRVRVFVLNRECPKSRCITNHNALMNHLRTDPALKDVLDVDWAVKYHVKGALGVMDAESLKTQASIMRQTDVLIGVHGSGLTNGIFMEEGSTAIELLHPRLYEPIFASMIESAGNTHEIFATSTPDPQCAGPMRAMCGSKPLLAAWRDGGCRQRLKNCKVTIDSKDLQTLTRRLLAIADRVFTHKRPTQRGL